MNIQELADRFIDDMVGTCNGTYHFQLELGDEVLDIEEAVARFGFNEIEFWQLVDDRIFNCATCGWWCEVSEMCETRCEQVCDQCYDDETEE